MVFLICVAERPIQSFHVRYIGYTECTYSIITDENFVIKNVRVLEFYSEYGYQITNKKWLKQFIGLDGQNLEYNNEIDAISGATISVKSLIDDVEIACKLLREANTNELTSE